MGRFAWLTEQGMDSEQIIELNKTINTNAEPYSLKTRGKGKTNED